jgi:hypothetical protein
LHFLRLFLPSSIHFEHLTVEKLTVCVEKEYRPHAVNSFIIWWQNVVSQSGWSHAIAPTLECRHHHIHLLGKSFYMQFQLVMMIPRNAVLSPKVMTSGEWLLP